MRLCEAEAKALLASRGIAIPRGHLVDTTGSPSFDTFSSGGAAKAQLLAGGRGKSGLVRLAASAQELTQQVGALRALLAESGSPARILVEERLEIACEYYLAFVIDDVLQRPKLLFSREGGIHIEDATQGVHAYGVEPGGELRPHQLLPFFSGAGINGTVLGPLTRLAVALHRCFVSEDLEMLEINPLALTAQGRLVPLDAKIVLDDSAMWRHRDRRTSMSAELEAAERTPLEREAAEAGFTFVEMPGDVALMSSGAGLGMMLVDLIGQVGLQPACFVDGAFGSHGDQTAERLALVMKRAESADVRAILFYQNLGTRDLKPRIESLLKILQASPPPKPFYFGMSATYLAERNMTAKRACELMREHGFFASDEPRELVARIREDLSRT